MWNEKRSLMLSRVCTLLAGVAAVACLVAAPWLVNWLTGFSVNAHRQYYGLFLATLYSGGGAALVLLYSLYRLLNNIAGGTVFAWKNIAYLRRISWCCFAGGLICMASALYYMPWCMVGLAAAFVGLIVRVVKNVIAEAITLKEENDFTI